VVVDTPPPAAVVDVELGPVVSVVPPPADVVDVLLGPLVVAGAASMARS
jgi:hypothetical protein